MKLPKYIRLTTLVLGLTALLPNLARSQVASETLKSLSTPDKVETRIGALEFKDGMPSQDTLAKVYDNLDFTHAFDAFVNTFQGASTYAINQGFLSIGVQNNQIAIFSDLMDSK